jgi:hypothetical protein
MKKGLLITLVGSVLALLGLTVLPFFELEQLLMNVHGYEFPEGQVMLGMLAVVLAACAIIFVLKLRRVYGAIPLVAGLLLVCTQTYIFLACPEIFETSVIIGHYGYYLVALGVTLVVIGGLTTVNADHGWLPTGPYLRIAQMFHGAVIREEMFMEPVDITAGEGLRNQFTLPPSGLPTSFKLFTASGHGQYKLGLTGEMAGQVCINGVKADIPEYVKKHTFNVTGFNYVPFNEGDWGVWSIGAVNLFFRFVRGTKAFSKMGWIIDRNLIGAVLASFVLWFGMMFFSLFSWIDEPDKVKVDAGGKIMKVEVEVTKEDLSLLDDGEEEDTTGKQAEGEEGKFGDPDLDPNLESKIPKRDGKMVKEIDPKKVGLNDLLSNSQMNKGAIADILSSDMSGFSNKLAVAMSGSGAEFVLGHGSGGLGFKGTGRGGGGLGGYGRIQGLGKIDTGGGVGMKASLGKKGTRKVARIDFGQGSAEGFCEKGNIRSVVMRRVGAIKACYEQQLILKPDLQGKVDVRWTINAEGGVDNATVIGTTLNDGNVENCVVRQIRRMKFAKPKGGICIVKWPFVFNPAG